jgi:hypothetical protein
LFKEKETAVDLIHVDGKQLLNTHGLEEEEKKKRMVTEKEKFIV